MADSIATPAKTESAQPDFSHGLVDLCTGLSNAYLETLARSKRKRPPEGDRLLGAVRVRNLA
jgi:hypothetical protein